MYVTLLWSWDKEDEKCAFFQFPFLPSTIAQFFNVWKLQPWHNLSIDKITLAASWCLAQCTACDSWPAYIYSLQQPMYMVLFMYDIFVHLKYHRYKEIAERIFKMCKGLDCTELNYLVMRLGLLSTTLSFLLRK